MLFMSNQRLFSGADMPWVQGILNLTPDSFFDGSPDDCAFAAVERGLAHLSHGARIIDVGGESTRPGYTPITADEEIRRTIPVITALSARGACISVDTHKPCVMRAALMSGACIINDVNAFHGVDETGSALGVAQSSECGMIIMDGFSSHSQAQKQSGMNLIERLSLRHAELVAHGIAPERLMIDPGIGFDKTLDENLDCLRLLPQLKAIAPVLIGGSRKSMLGSITGRSVQDRMPASIALALLAAQNGAAALRVHDVAPTVDALKVWQALR
jgi:dihydropteroate synthase